MTLCRRLFLPCSSKYPCRLCYKAALSMPATVQLISNKSSSCRCCCNLHDTELGSTLYLLYMTAIWSLIYSSATVVPRIILIHRRRCRHLVPVDSCVSSLRRSFQYLSIDACVVVLTPSEVYHYQLRSEVNFYDPVTRLFYYCIAWILIFFSPCSSRNLVAYNYGHFLEKPSLALLQSIPS